MFSIIPQPTFTCTVNLTVAGSDEPASIKVTWRHKGRKELGAWLRAGNALADIGRELHSATALGDAAWLAEAMVGWDGPVDAAGAPVLFAQAELALLLDRYPPAGGELLAAYLHALTESRAKN